MTGEELRNSNEYKFVMFSNGLYNAVCDKLGKQVTKDVLINDFKIDKRIAKKVEDGCEKLTIEEIVRVANELDLKLNVSLEFIPKKPPIEFVEELLSDLVSKYTNIIFTYAIFNSNFIVALMKSESGEDIIWENDDCFTEYCKHEESWIDLFYEKYRHVGVDFIIVDKLEDYGIMTHDIINQGKTIKWDFENGCVKIE